MSVRRCGCRNLCHQVIFVNHNSGAVTPPDTEMVQAADAIWQRAKRRGLVQGAVRPRQPGAGPWRLALGDSELVSQHQDLGVLPPRFPPRQPQHRYHTRDNQEDQLQAHKPKIIPPLAQPSSPGHGMKPTRAPSGHLSRWHRFSAPTGSRRSTTPIAGRDDQLIPARREGGVGCMRGGRGWERGGVRGGGGGGERVEGGGEGGGGGGGRGERRGEEGSGSKDGEERRGGEGREERGRRERRGRGGGKGRGG